MPTFIHKGKMTAAGENPEPGARLHRLTQGGE